ncbi:MarR family winged helix-turn-helix transcriptional regulator [Bradyrhizobium sp. ma5]|uniref:MarR family winged helix-turn-helix transcriptional regulator n=1 Tax=Bradyrhizobium sp. ma5 TaxID=3344828 RepID=UPI0035D45382
MAKKKKSDESRSQPTSRSGHSVSPRARAEVATLDLSTYLPFRLGILSQRLLREASLIYKRASTPLTTPQWMVVCIVANHQPLLASEISRVSLIDEVGVSRAVASLERLDLVSRQKSRQDQRVLEISLTASGHALYRELAAKMQEQALLIQAAITREELQMFLGLLGRLDAVTTSMEELRRLYGEAADVSELFAELPAAARPRPEIPHEMSGLSTLFPLNLQLKRR